MRSALWTLWQILPPCASCWSSWVGFGKTRCAHGLLPVPAPATAELLLGVPIRAGNIEGELCTPTGAALIRQFVSGFGPMPLMTVERMGYGLGQKDFPAANCLRAMLGQG